MTDIKPGDRVVVEDAHGGKHKAIAEGEPYYGTGNHCFVWVRLADDTRMPWPIEWVEVDG